MKFVLFERPGSQPTYGILSRDHIVPLGDALSGDTPQDQLQQLIEEPRLQQTGANVPLSDVRLLPPVPRPGKIVLTTATYGVAGEPAQLLATLKSSESVIGPGDTVRLPATDASWQFFPQAAIGLVMRGPAKDISPEDWRRAVFGYTCVIDVMARGDQQFGRDFWLGKADTLGPLGPCIVTSDEISDVGALRVRSTQNGAAAQDFLLSDASHSIPEQIKFVTTVMTLHSGDVLVCGSSPHGQRPVGDGDRLEVEIDGIGRLEVRVSQMAEVRA